MVKQYNVLGVITARGGSKGIKKKNIVDLCGKPLICYSIDAAQKSQYLKDFLISTDAKDIAKIGKDHGADVPFMRPKELSEDDSKSIDVVLHALEWAEKNWSKKYDYVMILQPTSPFREPEDIDESIKLAYENKADSVISMKELSDFSMKKLKKIKDNKIIPFSEDEGQFSDRRQDLEPIYKRNCAIYLTKTELIRKKDLFGEISIPYIMSEDRSLDINEKIDLFVARVLMCNK